MTGEEQAPKPDALTEPAHVFGQLDLFIEAEQTIVRKQIEELEAQRPALLDSLDKKIAFHGLAARLEGRAEEIGRLRDRARNWQEGFTKDEKSDSIKEG